MSRNRARVIFFVMTGDGIPAPVRLRCMIGGTGPSRNQGKPNMKHAGFIAGIVIVAGAMTATAVMAAGPGRHGERASFEQLDGDGDGQITKAELEAHRAAQFASRDTDGDGLLSAEELGTAVRQRASERAAAMIERFDANGDGLLAPDEMPTGRRGGDMFDRIDADNDGAISQQEFADARAGAKQRFGHRRGHGGSDQN